MNRRGRKKKGLCPVCGTNLQVTKEELFETLNIEEEDIGEGITDELIKKKYKEQARIHHPDKGGDPSLFQELTDAKEELMDMIDEDPLNISPIGDALRRQADEMYEEPTAGPERVTLDQLKEVMKSIRNLKKAKAADPNMPCPLCKKRPKRQ